MNKVIFYFLIFLLSNSGIPAQPLRSVPAEKLSSIHLDNFRALRPPAGRVQQKGLKRETGYYVSSESGSHMGQITLLIRGNLVTLSWDRSTKSAPIFKADQRGYRKGAEWRIVYEECTYEGVCPHLVSAAFTGRIKRIE